MKNIFYTGIGSHYTSGTSNCYYTNDQFMDIFKNHIDKCNNKKLTKPVISDYNNYSKKDLDKCVKYMGALYLNDFNHII